MSLARSKRFLICNQFILALTLIFRVTIGLDFVEQARPIKHLPAVTTFKILQHNRKLQDGYQKLA